MTNAAVAGRTAANHHTVLIADDHVLMRDGIKLLVAGMLGSVTFFEVGDGDALFVAARRTPPAQLALIDLKIPGMHGGVRLLELARRHPEIPLVVVSALSSADVVHRIMSIPTVYAFVPKTANREMVRSAVHAAMQGTKLQYAHGYARNAPPEVGLTPRQGEIRNLLRQGLRNKMIARILGISEGTVKNHITEIFRALKATNRTQVAQLRVDPE